MGNRRPLIAGNWKMFKTGPEAREAAAALKELTAGTDAVDVMIAPPFTALCPVHEAIAGSHIHLGAQNLHWEKEGAFTGEVAPAMLKAAGCTHVIIGHSERRQYFGETDSTVNNKIRAAIAEDLVPVFCIGETEGDREAGNTFSVLEGQIREGLAALAAGDLAKLVIAYEPVWAIGTGKTATPAQVQEVHAFIRGLAEQLLGNLLAKSMRILYGGSVKPDNVSELMALEDVDGALVGGASLDPGTFSKIVGY